MVTHAETPLVVPPGKKTGCLLRGTAFGRVFAPMAENVRILPWEEIRQRIDPALGFRPYLKVTLDQNSAGSCATESTSQGIMGTRVKRGGPHVTLNPWSMYQSTSGGRDNGSNIDDNLAFASKYGCLPEAVWPRSKGWRATPPQSLWEEFGQHFKVDEVYDIGSIQEVATALIEQYAVVYGWNGHSCLLTELLDEDTAEYKNSWGSDWGDDGYGKIKLRSINFGYGAWAVRTTTICPPEVIEAIRNYTGAT